MTRIPAVPFFMQSLQQLGLAPGTVTPACLCLETDGVRQALIHMIRFKWLCEGQYKINGAGICELTQDMRHRGWRIRRSPGGTLQILQIQQVGCIFSPSQVCIHGLEFVCL